MNLAQMERKATLLDGRPDSVDDLPSYWSLEAAKELVEFERGSDSWRWHWQRAAAEGPTFMDGAFYRDYREPHIVLDESAVSLSTTAKALAPAGCYPPLGGDYFARPGKKLHIRAFGKITTAATPGNLTASLYFGTGADANGTAVVSSAAQTLIANQTNISWMIEMWARCTGRGQAGGTTATFRGQGFAIFGTAVIAAGTFLIPASASVDTAGIDATASSIMNLQALRSGSTAEAMTVQDLEVEAMN